jgi:threonine synthase
MPECTEAPRALDARLRCFGCGHSPEKSSAHFRCERCDELMEIVYPAWSTNRHEISEWKKRWSQRLTSQDALDTSGVWRFREMLPFSDSSRIVTLREGNTPLYSLPKASHRTGIERLFVKHQGLNPTGSFKDTGMTVGISAARFAGAECVACASTGNTAASMAAYAARAEMKSLVLLPKGQIALGKLSQALEYGAVVCQLDTNFDGCLQILSELVQRAPVYLVNSVNPYRIEGQKTVAFEILEQFNWEVPDHVIVPGGNLGNSSGIGKGFFELHQLGLIPQVPAISIIQAAGANPLFRSVNECNGDQLTPMEPETYATAIRIGNPASWKKAVDVLRKSGGSCEQVSEEEIAQAKIEIGEEGIGCEPASAVTLAGLRKLLEKGFVQRDQSVVLVLTGNLLKDPDYSIKFHTGKLLPDSVIRGRNAPVQVSSNADAILRVLERQR